MKPPVMSLTAHPSGMFSIGATLIRFVVTARFKVTVMVDPAEALETVLLEREVANAPCTIIKISPNTNSLLKFFNSIFLTSFLSHMFSYFMDPIIYFYIFRKFYLKKIKILLLKVFYS